MKEPEDAVRAGGSSTDNNHADLLNSSSFLNLILFSADLVRAEEDEPT